MPFAEDDVVGATSEGRPVHWSQVCQAIDDVREWLDLKLTSGACSLGLLYQLAGHWCRMPQLFGKHLLLVDVHAVFDQIGAMDGAPTVRAVRTKSEIPCR